MPKNNVWYLPGPFHRYEGDLKEIAKKQGLVIVDANVTEDRSGEAEKVPEAVLKPEWRDAEAIETDPLKMGVKELRTWLTANGVEFDAALTKPDLQKLIPST